VSNRFPLGQFKSQSTFKTYGSEPAATLHLETDVDQKPYDYFLETQVSSDPINACGFVEPFWFIG
jgi:hypothetical protein